jgi:hypothetical protein
MYPIFLSLSILAYGICGNDLQDRLLFDGVSMNNWEIIDYEGGGDISIADSSIIINKGDVMSGIRWTGDFPKSNYEVTLYARRIDGNDFFCGLTFPVKDSFLTLVLGGWGGAVTGLSCIDGADAANNITQTIFYYGKGWWWDIRLRVTDEKVEAWIAEEKFVDFTIGNSKLSLRSEVEPSIPFGFTTYKTTGALRDVKLRMIK